METKYTFITGLAAVAGTCLVWGVLLSPVLWAVLTLLAGSFAGFEIMLPVELFPVALVGGVMLVWAAVQARSQVKLIGIALGVMAGVLVGGLLLSVLAAPAAGQAVGQSAAMVWSLLGMLSLLIYFGALIGLAVGAGRLVGELRKPARLND